MNSGIEDHSALTAGYSWTPPKWWTEAAAANEDWMTEPQCSEMFVLCSVIVISDDNDDEMPAMTP